MLKNPKLTTGNNITYGGPWGTVPELLFEKKGLIPALQRLIVSYLRSRQ
jgi:hypothetical protein